MNELAKVNRFELIDHTQDGKGRVYVKYANNIMVKTDLQDSNRTLKIFVTDTKAPIPTSRKKVNQMYAFSLLNEVTNETSSEAEKQVHKLLKDIVKNA